MLSISNIVAATLTETTGKTGLLNNVFHKKHEEEADGGNDAPQENIWHVLRTNGKEDKVKLDVTDPRNKILKELPPVEAFITEETDDKPTTPQGEPQMLQWPSKINQSGNQVGKEASQPQQPQPQTQPIMPQGQQLPQTFAQQAMRSSAPLDQQAAQAVPSMQPQQAPITQATQPASAQQLVQPIQQQSAQIQQPVQQQPQQTPGEVILHAGKYAFGKNFPEGNFDIRVISGEGMLTLFDGDKVKVIQKLGGQDGALGWNGMPSSGLSHFLIEGNVTIGVSRAQVFVL